MSDHRRNEDPTSTAHFGAYSAPDDNAPEVGVSTDDKDVIAALPPASALLIVQRGPNRGARFLLDSATTTAGRHPASDIFLDDVTVSRKHCIFEQEAGGYRVRDIGSLNGTYINRQRIDAAALTDGDEVQIGKYRLTFHASPNREAGAEQR